MKTLTNTHRAWLIAALLGATLALSAHAQPTSVPGPLPFSAYDQNSDGSISAEEFKAIREQRRAEGRPMRNAPSFATLDSNNDGKLSAEEFSAQANAPMGRRPGGGAGPGGNMPAFAEYDLNKDGKISEAEFTEARSARISKRAQEGYPMRGLANAPAFADIDSNHDGALSTAEFSSHQMQHRQQMGW
ncbi:MAG: hypothetical protein H6R15_1773 [Proteobacteria bacterium]|nr:hypothetical protein [Pseudomonadota bacterium]